jgi:hypothetical protein
VIPTAIHAPPTMRAPECRTTTLAHARIENTAPSTAGSGSVPFPARSDTGTLNALGRPLSR